MGVDIYGIAPIISSKKPERETESWAVMSDEEKQQYFDDLEKWEAENPGYYFRNNWWHWRPIVGILANINDSMNLGITDDEFSNMSENSGTGITDPEKCIKIANALESVVEKMKENNVDYVYLNTGTWYYSSVGENGETTSYPVENKELTKSLSESVKKIDLLFALPTINNVEYRTSHGTNVENLQEFAVFLKNCNGFQVY